MIQWGSGLFEYTFNDEVILSGKIGYLHDIDLNTTSDETITLNKIIEDFQGSVSNDEIYAILENSGYSLGDNYKNIVNFDVYKKNIQGYVKWENDWIYFLDGLLKFPLLEHLNMCYTEAPVSIRQISIAPKMFEKKSEKSTIEMSTNTNMSLCVLFSVIP